MVLVSFIACAAEAAMHFKGVNCSKRANFENMNKNKVLKIQ